MQWDGTVSSATEVINWVVGCGGTAGYHEESRRGISPYRPDDINELTIPARIAVDTLDSVGFVFVGDWVIRGAHGEFYPCAGAVFDDTYVPRGTSEPVSSPVVLAAAEAVLEFADEHLGQAEGHPWGPDVELNVRTLANLARIQDRALGMIADTVLEVRDGDFPSYSLIVAAVRHLAEPEGVDDHAANPLQITPPWTAEQVDRLNRWQQSPAVHSYTCSDPTGRHGPGVELEATTEGWVCSRPLCPYTQNWALNIPSPEE